MRFTIKLDKKNIETSFKEVLEKKLDAALNDVADFIGSESDRILRSDEGAFDTGFLANSLVIDKEQKLHKEIGYGASYAPFVEYGCFFDSNTKVTTTFGKKNIKDIDKNDIVLTHNGEWKKVLHLVIHEISNIVTEYTIRIGKKILKVTEDHPILVRQNGIEIWKLAKNLKIGDEVVCIKYNGMDLNGVKEKHLKAVQLLENRKKFSNSHYQNSSLERKLEINEKISKSKVKYYENPRNREKTGESLRNSQIFQNKMKDEERRKNQSKTKKEYFETHNVWNKGLTKECSDSVKSSSEKNSLYMKQFYKDHPGIAIENSERMRKNSMFFNTKIEKKVDKKLIENNMDHKNQYRIFDVINRQFYCVDHFLPEYNLVIEDYGNYWHNFPNGNEQDKKRMKRIKDLGFNTLILWEDEINKGNFIEVINECIKNIKK